MVVVALAYAFDFFNGFHDAPNAISTVVATRVLSPAQAISLSAIFNLAAFLVFGVAVATTVGDGIVRPGAIDVPVILSALVAAVAFGVMSWRLELPTSSSHALIGGLVGAALARAGPASLQPSGLAIVVLFMFLSPVLGFLGASAMMALALRGFARGPSRDVRNRFGRLQVVSSCLVSMSHGANDGQKTMGIVTALLFASGDLQSFGVPLWVMVTAQLTIALGTLFGGWGVVRTLGFRLSRMDPVSGVSTETSVAAVVAACSILGIPVSTTQCVSGAALGASAVAGMSRVRWRVARRIGVAWLVTIPLTASLAGLTCILVSPLVP